MLWLYITTGSQGYSAMDFYGTMFVNTDQGQDYIGFVFGYQSNRRFYIVTWRHDNRNYGGSAYRGGLKGVQIKVKVIMFKFTV